MQIRTPLIALGVTVAATLFACAPPTATKTKPLPACSGDVVTFIETLPQPCDVQPPQVLNYRMNPDSGWKARCLGMGGTVDPYADLLCDNVDY